MTFKQSLITLRQRTISSTDRPVIYTRQVPGYMGKKSNIRDLSKVFRIGAPHSLKSDPVLYLKKKQNNFPKTTQVSSEEQKLLAQIAEQKRNWQKSKAEHEAQSKLCRGYTKELLEVTKRGEEKIINGYRAIIQTSLRLIQEQGRMMDRIQGKIDNLQKKLQKIQARNL